ncbi:MAG: serine protease [Trueperaceae bacterium]|nr:serine protease [Trueperaceae bacterium]
MRWFKTMLALALVAALGTASAQSLPRELRERILQAVVEVNRFSAAEGRVIGAGSGTIVSPDGYILTNFHVVGDTETGFADEWHAIAVTDPAAPDRPPEHRYWARYLGGEPIYDLAILQIVEFADESPIPPGTVFPYLSVGDSNTVYPGDPVFVFGYPGISGSTITFTQGSISGFLGEDLTTGGKQWLKTDAKLARGNSGGTAVNEAGVLIGIPTLRYQTDDGGYIEAQDYLRPVALAWPLLEAYARNVADARAPGSGGLGNQVAGVAPASANPLAPAAAPNPLTPAPTSPDPFATPAAPADPFADAPRPADPFAAPAADVTAETADGRLTFFQAGALTTTSKALDGGEYVEVYELTLTVGVPVYVELTSSAFDPYLVVLDPAGEVVVEVDDAPGMDLNAAASFVPAASGAHLIAVTSYAPAETGTFELLVREGGALDDGVAPGATYSAAASGQGSGFVGSLALGQLARSELGANSDVTPWHTYRVDVAPGTARLIVDMAADVDLDLFLRYGEEVTNWGDEGDWDYRDVSLEPRASLLVEAPAPGPWYIDVVWYASETGVARYSVRAR